MSKVISANDLARGTVVFFGVEGVWSADIGKAAIYHDAASAEAALAVAKGDEAKALVVEPFIVDRSGLSEGQTSMTLRNAIRAYGPTIDYRPVSRPNNG